MSERHREDVRIALPKLQGGYYKTIYADPPWAEVGGGEDMQGCSRTLWGNETSRPFILSESGKTCDSG